MTSSLLLLTGCGRSVKYGDEITQVRGWAGPDGTILYFTQLDYTKLSSRNEALDASVNAYIDGIIEDFYMQDENLAIAVEDYTSWDEELDGRAFPTATEEEFEDNEAEGCFYDVIRIITEADRGPYVSFRTNRITYSSKNNLGTKVLTATFDAETGEMVTPDDIFTPEERAAVDEEISDQLRKEYGDELKEGYEDRVASYGDGLTSQWYIEGEDFVVLYPQGLIASRAAGDIEIHVHLPKTAK